jgi:hypothetical protein
VLGGIRLIWCLITAKKELHKKVETCLFKLGLFASCLVLGKLLSGHREKGIVIESRNMLDDLCQIGLRGLD